MSTPPVIRGARAADLPVIAAIYAQAVAVERTAHRSPPDDDHWDRWLAAHPADRRPVLVAEVGGTVVGWLSIGDHRPGREGVAGTAEVSIYLDAGHTGQGIGSVLLAEAEARAGELGIHTWIAILLDDNTGSVAFFEHHGFERWGHLPEVARFGERRVGQLYLGRGVGEDRTRRR